MPIKNYTTKVPAVQTVGEIQGILAAHGARKVMINITGSSRSGVGISRQKSINNWPRSSSERGR